MNKLLRLCLACISIWHREREDWLMEGGMPR